MKPWFEKEADIIDFPAPKEKVIKMPSVAEYPDFLTGVKDLHNGLEKGEISQDSHDKLYQDLIHRFMKKESFETPWFLREYADLEYKRPGQDVRYALDDSKLKSLGWQPQRAFDQELPDIVDYYKKNFRW